MLKDYYSDIFESTGTASLLKWAQIIILIAGVLFSLLSLKGTFPALHRLLADRSAAGNEPYLVALILTSLIGLFILISVYRTSESMRRKIIRREIPAPSRLEDWGKLEGIMVKRQIDIHANDAPTALAFRDDRSFIKNVSVFFGLIVFGLTIKYILPVELFWRLGLIPDEFSFPLFFMGILAAGVGLRRASLSFCEWGGNPKVDALEVAKLIKGEANPFTFSSEIQQSLFPFQQDGNFPLVYPPVAIGSGYTVKNSLGIQKKFFIETFPRHSLRRMDPILFFYLLFAVVSSVIGFIFLTALPPDNISVLGVPAIVIGYVGAIAKGMVLVVVGQGFLKRVSIDFRAFRFESVLAYIDIEFEGGEGDHPGYAFDPEMESPDMSDRIRIRSDYQFKVYTTRLCSEIDGRTGKRYVISARAGMDSERARDMIMARIQGLINQN
ncbi:MAG: hypothetical protein ACM3SY_11950 [Candidatus Omnitrophota bacterium]